MNVLKTPYVYNCYYRKILLFLKDSDGNIDSADISITFTTEDLLPPRFVEDFYHTTIQSPEFTEEQILIIEPSGIEAIDGDEIREEIVYSITQQTCRLFSHHNLGRILFHPLEHWLRHRLS